MHTSDINPSEDDRELIIAFLQQVQKDTEYKSKEVESMLKKSRQRMNADEIKELEKEAVHYDKNLALIEDALSKSERTSGHTLKKAFNKKLFMAVRQVEGEKKCEAWESLLDKNGLCHPLKVRRLSEHVKNQPAMGSAF